MQAPSSLRREKLARLSTEVACRTRWSKKYSSEDKWLGAGLPRAPESSQIRAAFRRSALLITETDDRLIAAAATIGDSNNPKTG